MPPRFAYWTILIDNKPTAFRARDRQELLPTLAQLKRTNQNVEMRWFAQGRLWDSPEAQHTMGRGPKYAGETRSKDWRPGGEHKDPRARFDKEAHRRKRREERAEWNKQASGPPGREQKPWRDKPSGTPPRGDGRLPAGSSRDGHASGDGWQTKPTGPRSERKPWQHKPTGDPPRGDRPWQTKPTGPRAERKPWQNKPSGSGPPRKAWGGKRPGPPRGDRPWSGKPRSDRPWNKKPPHGDRPWQGQPPGGPPRDRQREPFRPHGSQGAPPQSGEQRRRRDDEPPDRD